MLTRYIKDPQHPVTSTFYDSTPQHGVYLQDLVCNCGANGVASVYQPTGPKFEDCRDFYFSDKR